MTLATKAIAHLVAKATNWLRCSPSAPYATHCGLTGSAESDHPEKKGRGDKCWPRMGEHMRHIRAYLDVNSVGLDRGAQQ